MTPNGSQLQHTMNGWWSETFGGSGTVRPAEPQRTPSRSAAIRSRIGLPVSLHNAVTLLPRSATSVIQKKLRQAGFKGAVVEPLLKGDGGGFTVDYQGREYKFWIEESVTMHTRNGSGIYHGTPAGKNDFVIFQGRGNRYRLDLVTDNNGKHIDVTGPNSGYETPEAAFEQALGEQHRRGIRGKAHVYIADKDGNFSDYEPTGAHLPFERNARGRGARRAVGCTCGAKFANPHTAACIEKANRADTSVVDRRARYEFSPRSPDGSQDDDYAVAVVDRDSNIGVFRVQGGRLSTEPLGVSANMDEVARIMERDAHSRGSHGVAVFELNDRGWTQIGNIVNGRWQESGGYAGNGRTTVADPTAARELSLYIENEYALIGAPNSIGKSIDANLRRKRESGKYDYALSPRAWRHLIDEGAKRYTKEFGSDGGVIFSAATRRQVAEEFARAWEEENLGKGTLTRNPRSHVRPVQMTASETAMYRRGEMAPLRSLRATAQDRANRNHAEVSILTSDGEEIEWCTPLGLP